MNNNRFALYSVTLEQGHPWNDEVFSCCCVLANPALCCPCLPSLNSCFAQEGKVQLLGNHTSAAEKLQPCCPWPWILWVLSLGLSSIHPWARDNPRNVPSVPCVLLVQPGCSWPAGGGENSTTLCLKRNPFKVLVHVSSWWQGLSWSGAAVTCLIAEERRCNDFGQQLSGLRKLFVPLVYGTD